MKSIILGLLVIVSGCTYMLLHIVDLSETLVEKQRLLNLEQNLTAMYIEEIQILSNEIVLRQDLTSLIIDAARSYNLDPMLLAKVIKSESNFRPNPKHSLPNVIGPGGINIKAHKHLKHNPESYVGNIYASAEILSYYIDDSKDSLTLALTRYKGLSPLGLAQAKQIVDDYKNGIKEK